jgi:hypothetical protein
MKHKILFTCLLLCSWLTVFSQTGIIKGSLVDATNNEPILFANILVLDTDIGTTTDENGNFKIEVKPGVYNIRFSYVGYKNQTLFEVAAKSSRPTTLEVKMETTQLTIEEVVVKASPFRKTEESPVSLRNIGITEIKRNPGGNRDISRVVQNLPGVTSTASFRNDLIIRGGAPNENRFYLDDVEVPNINHFATQGASGGPVGLINVDFIKEVDFYSGAFPANRGNTLSSVFNFKQKDGRDDRIGYTATVGASDIGLTMEGPIGDKTTFLLSARRSYLQFLFEAIGLPFLPTYNDFQAKVKYKPNNKNEFTFIGLGAIDQFELNLDANETESQRFQLGFLPVNTQWNYTNGLVYKRYRDHGYWTFVLSRNMLNNEAIKYRNNDESSEDNLTLDYLSQEIENKLRIENTIRTGNYKINYGVAYEFVKYNNRTYNKIFTNVGEQEITFNSDFSMNKYGVFGQVSRSFLKERLIVSLGARMDGNSYSNEMANLLEQFSPRLSIAYALTDRFSINFNTGIYYQLPPYTVLGYQENGEFINKNNDIKYIQSNHIVGGLEYKTASNSIITLEGYYKTYSDYPFLLRDSISLANLGGDFGVIGNEPAVSTGKGRSYGIEVLFQQRLYKGFYGIASYTLGRSEFEDKNGDFVPSAWDARHILNLTLGKSFKKNWEVGINWRLQTGLPITPFDNANSALVNNWNVNGRALPNYNLLNTQRQGDFTNLNVRVDKKWNFKKWDLNLFLDIQNVLGATIPNDFLVLDVPLDEQGTPIGGPTIINPNAPTNEQQYLLKTLTDNQGTTLPTLGIVVGF